MLNSFYLALQSLWREIRSGEWTIVFFSLLLAITAITSMHLYIDRLLRGLEIQNTKFIGGDLVISSSTPISLSWIKKAQSLKLKTAEVWLYSSVVSANNYLQLVNIQAVTNNYPLVSATLKHPDKNTVWVEPRLLPLLSTKLNDSITIGVKSFKISKILTSDIDTLNTGWVIAPRVMMLLDDVDATKTVIPGSRIDYRLLIVGEKSTITEYRQWIQPLLNPGQSLVDSDNQSSALRNILYGTENYLQLGLLVCLILSGVAITLSIQQYMRRHYSQVALWRCLGANQRQIVTLFIWQLLIIAFTAGIFAVMLGYIAQNMFVELFKNFVNFPLPAASISPALLGIVTCFILLFSFSYPILIELAGTSPLAVWRNEYKSSSLLKNYTFLISLGLLLLFIYWMMGFSQITLWILIILVACTEVLYGLSQLVFIVYRFILLTAEGPLRRGLNQLLQHADSVSLQFICFSLIFIFLVVLGLMRANLIDQWRGSLPAKTPNYFVINIAPTDIPKLEKYLHNHQVHVEAIYPMIRGRLNELNGKPILSMVPKEAQNNNALHRELNLSWMWDLPSDNKIVSGKPWSKEDKGKPLISVESKLAKDLHLELEDELTFQIGDKKLVAKVANFRTLDWASFHPNFFMIFPPGLFNDFPTTYITSIHLGSNEAILLNELVKQFPNITIIDVSNILEQVQDLLGKVIIAMQYLFLFSLGIGILILVACFQASIDERRITYQLLHILGANKKYLFKSMIVEYASFMISVLIVSFLIATLILTGLKHYFITI